jgi:hypothetical protein
MPAKVSARLSELRPNRNEWFESSPVYEGYGVAEFTHPVGRIEGHSKVSFDQRGRCRAELIVENTAPKIDNGYQFMAFMEGVPLPQPRAGDSLVGDGSGRQNPCTAFTVTTAEGVFTARHSIFCSYAVGGKAVLKLQLSVSQFDSRSQVQPRFWAMPLSNFISEFAQRHPQLDRHPLRIYPTPVIPSDLTQEEASLAPWVVNSENRLIIFEFGSALAFIEALPDFEDRKRELLSRQTANVVTAIMIGEIGSQGIEMDDLQAWIPNGDLDLLSVATGTRVGSPWIEFRDGDGELVRRIHVSVRRPAYATGHSAISEDINGGTGHLLSAYRASSVFQRAFFLVTLSNLIDGQMDGDTEENNLRHLFVAFETLCKEFGFSTQDLPLGLGDVSRNYVHETLQRAALQIEIRAAALNPQNDPDEIRTLLEIAERTRQTPLGKSRAFGLGVARLLDHFGLPDASILDAHFGATPRLDAKPTWDRVLSTYRGIVTHVGYFEQPTAAVDTFELYRIRRHLHDVLLRILFNLVGYKATYQPPVKMMATQSPIDWVTPLTTAEELGF